MNYFGLSAVTATGNGGTLFSSPGLPVATAARIDEKIDDGLPQSGIVTAKYLDYLLHSNSFAWPYGGGLVEGASGTAATAASSATCYDNANVSGAIQRYSVTQNNGAGVNCAMSFKFQ